MSLRINTNVAAIAARRSLNRVDHEHDTALRRLSSGKKHAHPGSDAAGFAISEKLRGDVASLKQAHSNTQGAISLAQVAEGGLNEQFNIAVRLRELAIQSASDTVSDVERGFMQEEFGQLTQEFDRIAKTTRIGNDQLLTNSGKTYEFQVGNTGDENSRISFTLDNDTSAVEMGLDDLEISDKDDARSSLETIDSTLTSLAGVRAKFGAIQSRFEFASNNLEVQTENTEAARSRIADADIAEESSRLVKSQILREAAIATLAQANQGPSAAIKLIG